MGALVMGAPIEYSERALRAQEEALQADKWRKQWREKQEREKFTICPYCCRRMNT